MIHLRIVVPSESSQDAQRVLEGSESACNLIVLEGAARKPAGDLLLVDVAREDASVIISELRELNIDRDGSIALDDIDSQISAAATRAEKAARGLPADAVVWEEIESRTSEEVELSATFLGFMALAIAIAAIGIITDQIVLIIGAMVVGPEFGPVAALAVAAVERRPTLARKSLLALAVGFPLGIAVAVLGTLALDAAGFIPADLYESPQRQTGFIANPDQYSALVAAIAGVAGMLSLTSAKSGALVGVLISVTTIPAAGGIAVGIALGQIDEVKGSAAQLAINLGVILLTCMTVLAIERFNYRRRKRRYEREHAPAEAPGRDSEERPREELHGT